MIKVSYDLHIHSCLSFCANDEMTPRSIALLANMVGLDVVAVTDHNTCKNVPAFFKAAEQTNIIAIAGLELNTAEEIHTLCLFEELQAALEFEQEVVLPNRMNIRHKENMGNQFIMDENDNIIGKDSIWLAPATMLPLYELSEKVNKYGGAIIPAHINRESWGLLSVLGDVPDDYGYGSVEIRKKDCRQGYEGEIEDLKKKYPYLNKCRIIHNSDAHRLEDISLPVNFIEIEQKSAKNVIKCLKM
ncbi:MAG: PHP domain-containing protein [Oscillospiraceae bacterium]|nr:PHP domain-containing protein [Oscillospiraceae bacterium]